MSEYDDSESRSLSTMNRGINENKSIKVAKCSKCRCSILINKIEYENGKIYFEIICPCQEVENLLMDNFEAKYIFDEKKEMNQNKIISNFLFCSCDNISKFEYYCKDSRKDLCSECIGKEKDHSNHSILNFKDINKIIDKIKQVYDEMNKIKEEFDEENEEAGEKENDKDENNEKKKEKKQNIRNDNELLEKYSNLEKENDKDNFKSAIKLLMELISQYEKNPYYNLYQSIENIYKFCTKFEQVRKDGKEERKQIIKKIIRFKREFKDLKESDNLKSINIFQNNFDDISILEDYSKYFKFLEKLFLSENNIDNIEVLTKIEFPSLKILNLTKNRLIDSCIEHLKNLKNKDTIEELNLYDNNIRNPKFFLIIKDFINLQTLFIGHNKFNENFDAERYDFPDSLTIIGLTIGVFSRESIKHIKKFYFNKLETLYLKGNDLDSLKFIEDLQCKNLKNIWLRNNAISDLNIKITNKLKDSIIKFNLRGNLISDITHLKDFVDQFENMEEFTISDNEIDLNSQDNLNIINEIIEEKKNQRKKFILKYL